MSTIHSRGARRIAAGLVGVLAIGAASLLGAGAAHAADGNIDTTTNGSLTIHKHLDTAAGAPANPDGSGTVAGPAVQGVEFTVYELNYNGAPVNLTQNTDWSGLRSVTLDSACNVTNTSASAPYTRGTQVVKTTTNASGVISYAVGTARKAYAVCETNVAGAQVNGAPVNIVTRAQPFVVTVPLPSNGSWIYDVNAYPKNSSTTVTKTVSAPNGYGLGSVVNFPVTVAIPTVASNDSLTSFIVSDTIDSRLGSTGVASVKLSDGTTVDPAYYTTSRDAANANKNRVAFTAAGLTWLKSQSGKSVVVTFTGTVTSVGNGGIANTAVVYINDPSESNGVQSNTVTTNWGDLIIRKSDSGSNAALTGASFQVYSADPAYPTAGGSCTSKTTTGAAISVNGQTTFTTGANGTVTVPGLFVSDSTNAPINASSRCYVLVETAAPAGYTLPTGDAAKTATAVNAGQSTSADISVPNTKQLVPALPLTGAAGQTVAVIAGSMLLLAGAVLMFFRRRRHAATQGRQQS